MKDKKQVLDSIKARKRPDGSVFYDAYLGVSSVTRKVVRIYGSDLEDVKRRVKEYYKPIEKKGELYTILTPMQMMDAKTAYDALARAGLTLSLVECANRVIGRENELSVRSTVTVGDAWKQYFAEVQSETSEANIRSVEARTGKWVAMSGGDRLLVDITPADIEGYLKSEYGGMARKTYNNHLQYIRTFFNWCMAKPRKWVAENPAEGLKEKKVVWVEPKSITPKDAKILFSALERDGNPVNLAYAVLSFFCGIRREEILRIAGKRELNESGDDPAWIFNLDSRKMAILKPKGFIKGIKPRAFDIPDTAYAWMRSFNFEEAVSQIREHTVDRVYAIGRGAGADIPKNCGRHSFITHHVVAYGSLERTLLIAGTSEGMSEDHYRSLRSESEGREYFSVLPTSTT